MSISEWADRKSTRLNSSHGYISYAVFCLKKNKKLAYARAQGTIAREYARRPSCRVMPLLLNDFASLAQADSHEHNHAHRRPAPRRPGTSHYCLLSHPPSPTATVAKTISEQLARTLQSMSTKRWRDEAAHFYPPIHSAIAKTAASNFPFFFFKDPAPPEISSLSLPAALPI